MRALGRGLAYRPLGRSEQSFRRVLMKSTLRTVRRTTSGVGHILGGGRWGSGEGSGGLAQVPSAVSVQVDQVRGLPPRATVAASGTMKDVWQAVETPRWRAVTERSAVHQPFAAAPVPAPSGLARTASSSQNVAPPPPRAASGLTRTISSAQTVA